MILIIGTPDSGKSAYAEQLAVRLAHGKTMAYIATMIPYGEDGTNRIKKHKKLREGKNFITYEEPLLVSHLIEELKDKKIDTALLECVSNLVGNVMHHPQNAKLSSEDVVQKIVSDILDVSDAIDNLIVVANDFEINEDYDDETVQYININNAANDRLREKAEKFAVKEAGVWKTYENN